MLALKLGFIQQENRRCGGQRRWSRAKKTTETTAVVSMDAAKGAGRRRRRLPFLRWPGTAVAAMVAMVAAVMAPSAASRSSRVAVWFPGGQRRHPDSIPARLSRRRVRGGRPPCARSVWPSSTAQRFVGRPTFQGRRIGLRSGRAGTGGESAARAAADESGGAHRQRGRSG